MTNVEIKKQIALRVIDSIPQALGDTMTADQIKAYVLARTDELFYELVGRLRELH